ncbi:MAG TPA: aldose 1-epimerase family protein [Candidatus Baltobacteraceae bacterium]|nr:aldose 1-epimerase family protein [Candidatus Baltobacteraceae bacterium]
MGDPRQLGGITPIVYDDGRARGTHGFLLRTGAGLEAEIVADRALDVLSAAYRGIPLTWRGPGGLANPAYSETGIEAFERDFFGGLMTTCGLQAFGPAGSDADGSWQQHGYVNHAPAQDVGYGALWEEDRCTFTVSGTVREARMFGATLRLERTWCAILGENTLRLHDRVTNEGDRRAPHMLLYHCNAGFPLLDEGMRLSVTHASVRGRDDVACAALDVWDRGGPPQSGFKEQVFIHESRAGDDGWARASASNARLDAGRGVSLTLRYRPDQLPALMTWRMLGVGTYVMAMEPANCDTIEGRIAARDRGTLPFLEPGETRQYDLEFNVRTLAAESSVTRS